jgi:hypothetical protein
MRPSLLQAYWVTPISRWRSRSRRSFSSRERFSSVSPPPGGVTSWRVPPLAGSSAYNVARQAAFAAEQVGDQGIVGAELQAAGNGRSGKRVGSDIFKGEGGVHVKLL